MHQILVAEDDLQSQRLMQAILKSQGWKCLIAGDGAEAWEQFRATPESFDLVIVDVMMPNVDGLELCRRIRTISSTTPVIITSALGADERVLRGIESGADDYLAKPINVQLLVAKIQRALDRGENETGSGQVLFECGDLAVDVRARRVTKMGTGIHLTRLEFGVLEYLIREKNHVRTPEEILKNVWGKEYTEDLAVLRAVIQRLRKKIQPDADGPQYVVTHVGAGYSCADLDAEPRS